MRRLLVLLFVMSFGLCAFAANWTQISNKIYLDVSGIMPDAAQNGGYTFWTKELNDGNSDFVISEKKYSQKIWYDLVRYSVNCSSRKIKMDDILVYGLKNNLLGTESGGDSSWHTVPPESIVEDYLELVCKTAAQTQTSATSTKTETSADSKNKSDSKTQKKGKPPAGKIEFTLVNPETLQKNLSH